MKAAGYSIIQNVLRETLKNRVLQKRYSWNCRWAKLHVQYRYMSFSGQDEHQRKSEEYSFSYNVPEKFNFASDVLDKWSKKEKEGLRSVLTPAFWYVSEADEELKLSFQDLERETKRMANILQYQCGIKQGDYVIVMLPKIPEFWFVNIAAIRIGFIYCPATVMLTVKDLTYRFLSLKPSAIIAHESVADIIDEADKLCPSLHSKILVSSLPHSRPGWYDLNRMKTEEKDHKCAQTNSNDTMILYFTSGTTGHPKMVEHTYASLGIGMKNIGKYGLDLKSDDIVWGVSDTGWAKAGYCSFFGPWLSGACVFVHQMSRFSSQTTLKVLSRYPIDILCAPPLVYRSLVQENLSAYKFKKLKVCRAGGEAMNVDIIRKWIEMTGLKIFEVYGQTETTELISMKKYFEYRIGATGKPDPTVNVKIVDENENEVKPGVVGEIVVEKNSTIGLLKGYKNDPELTKLKLTEKYYHTGDLAYYDEDGYFWFVGRNDDIINSAGYRIGPFEVENALIEHPAVLEAAVTSSPDTERGEVVKAFIILKKSNEPSETLVKEIQEHCKQTTAPYKYPRKIEFVAELPRTVTGKVKRSTLKQREWQKI